MRDLTHLSLFSGIGGLDLAAEWAGMRTVGQCEWADYPTKVLEKHWPDVPRWRDIHTLTGEDFYERTGLRTVDVISGGFPCQPFSVAGKRRGKEDDRFLWPEMVRVISELRPAWVIGENVAGIVNMALDDVLSDLEAQGYQTRTFLFPACAVGAPHRRYRVAVVAHSNNTTPTRFGEHGGEVHERAESEISGRCSGNARTENVEDPGRRRCSQSKNVCEQSGRTEPVGESEAMAYTKSNVEGRLPIGKKEKVPGSVGNGENVPYTNGTGCKEQYAPSITDREGFLDRKYNAGTVCNATSPGFPDGSGQQMERCEAEPEPERPGSIVPDANDWSGTLRRNGELQSIAETKEAGSDFRGGAPEHVTREWWSVEPNVDRVAYGIPSRVDRLKCLGNAVVPQQFYPVLKAIAEIEGGLML